MRIVVFFVLLVCQLLAASSIMPSVSVKLGDSVLDMVFRDGNLYASLANGDVVSIDKNGKTSKKCTLPKKQSTIGGIVPQRACSVDVSPDGKTTAIAGEDGCLYILVDGKLNKSSFSTKTVIKKILFSSNSTLVAALLSSEVVQFDISKNKVVSSVLIGTSSLSDISISSDKTSVFVATEAGIVSVLDTKSMKVVGKYQGGNVDNIYKLDTIDNFTITAGQDRRAILYNKNGKVVRRWDGSFLIYAAALSPSGKIAAIAMDEQNQITLSDTASGEIKYIAKGHSATLNRIVFMSENSLASCADENKIYIWRFR